MLPSPMKPMRMRVSSSWNDVLRYTNQRRSRVRRFELVLPGSLDECVKALAQAPADSKLLAGGTDLLPQLKNGLLKPACVIDLSGIPRLRSIEAGNGQGVRAGVASQLTLANGRCAKARIALAAVAPVPVRATAAEQALEGQAVTPDLIKRAADLAVEAARPISDQRGSADFRRHLVRVLTRRTLTTALARAGA